MHELEARQLLDVLADATPSVVCAAASVADVDECLQALADSTVVAVLLTVNSVEAAARFTPGKHRPELGADPAAFLTHQARERNPRYRAVAAIEVATDGSAPDGVVETIIGAVAARGVLHVQRDE